MKEKLAIAGGPKAVPAGTVKTWPPIDDIDRKMVLASLENPHHAFGPQLSGLPEGIRRLERQQVRDHDQQRHGRPAHGHRGLRLRRGR